MAMRCPFFAAHRLCRAALAAALALTLPGCGSSPHLPETPPERIVLIVVDTLRRDHLGAYGSALATPEIDSLAASGQVFENALSSYHQTTMSMASLFTGRTPSIEQGELPRRMRWTGETWCGMARFAEADAPGGCIPSSIGTLAESLRDAGYWTAGVVSNELLYRPGGYERGFQTWFEFSKGTPNAAQVNHVVRQVLEKRPGDRFFLYVHYMDVHSYLLDRVPYASRVGVVDEAVGELISMLRDAGLLKETVVFFTSDHGERLGEKHVVPGTPSHRGSPSFEQLINVPLIVSPAVYPDTAAALRGDDLHRMILELARVSERPGADLEPGELFLSERNHQTYRDGRWKSYRQRDGGRHVLVDLVADPLEKRDVAEQHPGVLAAHSVRMDELTSELAGRGVPGRRLSERDRARLRALGYAESE